MIELRHRMRGYEVVNTDDEEEELSLLKPFPMPNYQHRRKDDERKPNSDLCMLFEIIMRLC